MSGRRISFRRETLTAVEAAGARALRAKKRGKPDIGARAKALADFEAAKAELGPRFDAYVKALEHVARRHLRKDAAHALPKREAPTVASVFARFDRNTGAGE